MSATLVVYAALEPPLRESVADHLYSLRRYSRRPTIYLNLAVRRPPRWLRRVPLDLIVFHTTFLSKRGTPAYWERLVERARPLKALDAVRVALPQDEYLPPAPAVRLRRGVRDRPCVLGRARVAVAGDLPDGGPLADADLARADRLPGSGYGRRGSRAPPRASAERTIDIGYRAKDLPAWLGRHARLKAQIGDAFAAAAPAHGLSCDISTRAEDALVGDDWVRFLLSCRYTVGVEGGASVLDRDGSLRRCCERVLAERPDATFERARARVLPRTRRRVRPARAVAPAPRGRRDPHLPGPDRGRLRRRARAGPPLHPAAPRLLQPRRRAGDDAARRGPRADRRDRLPGHRRVRARGRTRASSSASRR